MYHHEYGQSYISRSHSSRIQPFQYNYGQGGDHTHPSTIQSTSSTPYHEYRDMRRAHFDRSSPEPPSLFRDSFQSPPYVQEDEDDLHHRRRVSPLYLNGQMQQEQQKEIRKITEGPPTAFLRDTGTKEISSFDLNISASKDASEDNLPPYTTPEEVIEPRRHKKLAFSSVYQLPTESDRPNAQASGIREDAFSETNNVSNPEWVTVFGFPPSKASFIINQFSQYGKILDHKMGEGNWVHIAYETKFEAEKALSKNAKIFDQVLMIGVVECTDPSVTNKPKKKHYLVRRPQDLPDRDKIVNVTGTKRIFSESTIEDQQEPGTTEKRRRPEPQKSIFAKVLDNIFKF
jgi:hypothetical protein